MVARQGRRAAFGIIAFIFLLGVLVLAEVASWQALRLYVASIAARQKCSGERNGRGKSQRAACGLERLPPHAQSLLAGGSILARA
jgi:hypothetical protein